MRIVFMGSPAFAVPSLEALVDAGHDVAAVYCQPPRPAGRGRGLRKVAVHERAEALGLDVTTPTSLRSDEAQHAFAALDADLAVVAAYGLILPRAILDMPRGGCINVHASLLPRWRGAAPIQRAILAGDDVSGVTIMRMDEGLDTGPMLLRRELGLMHKNAGQVTKEMAHLGAIALLDWLSSPAPPVPQPNDGVTYAAKIDKAETRIDWGRSADLISRKVRAFAPSPGAWFEVGGERIKLLDGEPVDGDGVPGTVVDGPLVIACGEDAIHCRMLQRAGKGPMPVDEFLRGFAIPEGARLA